jgi:hypothetical protein
MEPRMIRGATTEVQYASVDALCAAYRRVTLNTAPCDRRASEHAVAEIFRSVGLAPPRLFRWYDSPFGALRDFDAWRSITGRVANELFNYQMPRCDPKSYYRSYVQRARRQSAEVDLGLRRLPYARGRASTYAPPSGNADEGSISSELLDALWAQIARRVGTGWCTAVESSTQEEFEGVFDALLDVIDKEVPTNPCRECEYICLGPLDRFVWEAACSEACADILGVRTDPGHVGAICDLVRTCGTVYAFEDLAVLCDRPEEIRSLGTGGEPLAEVRFRDGERRSVRLDARLL